MVTAKSLCSLSGFSLWQSCKTSLLVQAEARQAKFDSTPGGKAARKAVANVAKEREADAAANAARGKDRTQDWLS